MNKNYLYFSNKRRIYKLFGIICESRSVGEKNTRRAGFANKRGIYKLDRILCEIICGGIECGTPF